MRGRGGEVGGEQRVVHWEGVGSERKLPGGQSGEFR